MTLLDLVDYLRMAGQIRVVQHVGSDPVIEATNEAVHQVGLLLLKNAMTTPDCFRAFMATDVLVNAAGRSLGLDDLHHWIARAMTGAVHPAGLLHMCALKFITQRFRTFILTRERECPAPDPCKRAPLPSAIQFQ